MLKVYGLIVALCVAALAGAAALLAARDSGSAAGAPPLEGAWSEDFTAFNPPVPAPPERFRTLAGEPVALGDFAGRVVLLNFWATWCAPCVHEMPALDRLQAALGEEGLVVLAVSLDHGGRAVVEPFVQKLGLQHLGMYLDEGGALSRALEVKGLPTTFLIDPKGRVVGAVQGAADWDSEVARALIRHYLRQPGTTQSAAAEL